MYGNMNGKEYLLTITVCQACVSLGNLTGYLLRMTERRTRRRLPSTERSAFSLRKYRGRSWHFTYKSKLTYELEGYPMATSYANTIYGLRTIPT